MPDYYGMLDGDIRGMRIGRMTELCDSPDMHADVRRAVDAAMETFAGLGAEISDVSLPLTEIAGAIFVGIADTEGAGARDDLMRRSPELLDRASPHSPPIRCPGAGQGAEPGHESPRPAAPSVRGRVQPG